jgi:hypothetical protein
MPIKRYTADKDTTITDAFKPNLIDRAYNSNMGASDSLEIFSIYAQASSNSLEKSRVLVQFPVSEIISDRNLSKLPASGSVSFFLKLFNVEHPFSVPKDFSANIAVVSQSWDEGYGLDMESYTDNGWAGIYNKGSGCNWLYSTSGTLWTSQGGSFLTQSKYIYNYGFKTGIEDLEVDVTNAVEDWINGTNSNNGFMVYLSGAFENGTLQRSFYTKKFSARGTQYFFKKPIIEARWNTSITDDRNNFFASSSALEASDNTMNLYFYNKVKGNLKNIVNNILPGVKFYSNSALTNEISSAYKVITNPNTGVYRVQVALNTTASVGYDRWYNTSSLTNYFSSSFDINQVLNYDYDNQNEYIINVTNLKSKYENTENARFKIFARLKDWQPTIYTTAYNTIENSQIQNLYYKIFRLSDNYVILDYSTGSISYTKTSYDSNGNYFDLDMKIFEKDYAYGIKLATYDGSELKEFSNIFKFRVE